MDNPLALSFGNEAARYERARPEWPPEVADLAHVSSDSTVLDLAAGTGKLTRVLAERFARVIAVEPDEAMRAYVTGVEALAGTAEGIPLPDASVDAAFVAEAFHWFDWKRAVAELARVLRPGAPLVLLWNYPRVWEPALPAAVDEALDRRFAMAVGPPGLRIYDSGAWREGFASAPFEPLREERVEYEPPPIAKASSPGGSRSAGSRRSPPTSARRSTRSCGGCCPKQSTGCRSAFTRT